MRIAVAVQIHEGAVLVRRRAENAAEYPGYWETPGGKMEDGETWAQAAAREFAEETGLACDVGGIVGAWRVDGAVLVAFHVRCHAVPEGFEPLREEMGPLVPSLRMMMAG